MDAHGFERADDDTVMATNAEGKPFAPSKTEVSSPCYRQHIKSTATQELTAFLSNFPVEQLINVDKDSYEADVVHLVDPHYANTNIYEGCFKGRPVWDKIVNQMESLRRNLLREAGQDQAIGDLQLACKDHEERLRILEAAEAAHRQDEADEVDAFIVAADEPRL